MRESQTVSFSFVLYLPCKLPTILCLLQSNSSHVSTSMYHCRNLTHCNLGGQLLWGEAVVGYHYVMMVSRTFGSCLNNILKFSWKTPSLGFGVKKKQIIVGRISRGIAQMKTNSCWEYSIMWCSFSTPCRNRATRF